MYFHNISCNGCASRSYHLCTKGIDERDLKPKRWGSWTCSHYTPEFLKVWNDLDNKPAYHTKGYFTHAINRIMRVR